MSAVPQEGALPDMPAADSQHIGLGGYEGLYGGMPGVPPTGIANTMAMGGMYGGPSMHAMSNCVNHPSQVNAPQQMRPPGDSTPRQQLSAATLTDMGTRLKAAGDWRGAVEHYYEALRLDPSLYAAQYNLGVVYLEAGDLQRALQHTEQAYQLDPRRVDAMNNMGAIHRAQGNHEAATQWYRAAIRLSPNCTTMQTNLAVALVSLGLQIKATDPKGAIKCYQESLVHYPTNASAYYNLGVSYAEMHKSDKALINYQLTVHFNRGCAEAYNNMGVVYKEKENLERALMCYHMALQCNPRFAQALNNIGMVYTATGRLQEALEYLSRAVIAAPTYAEAYNNLGWLFWDEGDLGQALRMYERCIELAPTSKNPGQNRLLALNYVLDVPVNLIFEAHRAWAERFSLDLPQPFTNWPVERKVDRRLRICYISPDFFHHSVSFFCHCLFEHRDRDKFDIFLYSNTSREDDKTELFKSMVPANRWKLIVGKSAQEVADMMREEQIDILVELAGHTANNRLDVAVLKPAPVQITYIGYNNTTGLGSIDYRVTDAIVDPVDTEQEFSEELVRLPGCFLCYTPPDKLPDVDPLPAIREGFITFGSFSCLAKLNPQCVALWARVLQEVPTSRLLIKAKGFYSRDVQAKFIAQFERFGIRSHRLKLLSLTTTSFDHLKTYNEVDIALDTFPYSNTTTTCEALVMGVPTICLTGRTHGSRVGCTLLTAINLPEFIAETREDYVEKAKSLANNLNQLSEMRQSLRRSLLASKLCDGPGFVREKYEPMLIEKWKSFCEGRAPSVQAYSAMEPPSPLAPCSFAPPLPPGASPITGQVPPTPAPSVASTAQNGSMGVAPQMLSAPAPSTASSMVMNGALPEVAAVPAAQVNPWMQQTPPSGRMMPGVLSPGVPPVGGALLSGMPMGSPPSLPVS